MKKTYNLSGVCSRSVSFEMDANRKITNISFIGGCDGNLKGISALCDGMEACEIIKKLKGIQCGHKATSCPDQLSKVLQAELKAKG